MIKKKCTRCGETKDISQFQKRAASSDGLTASCKKCLSDYDKKRANKPHRVKARENYLKTEQGKAAHKRAVDKYRKKNNIQYSSNNILNNAIRDGKIKKPTKCSICGVENVLIHGHHEDYSKPLEVIWCCEQCHEKLHGRLK